MSTAGAPAKRQVRSRDLGPVPVSGADLKTLRQAGLVESTRRGRFVDYRLTDDAGALVAHALRTAVFTAGVDQPTGCAPDCETPAR